MAHLDDLLSAVAARAAESAVERVLARGAATPEFLDTKSAAVYLGVSPQLLELWRKEGGGPRYTKLSHLVRYRRGDLERFMADRAVGSTSEGGRC